jgi:hypothetical protein
MQKMTAGRALFLWRPKVGYKYHDCHVTVTKLPHWPAILLITISPLNHSFAFFLRTALKRWRVVPHMPPGSDNVQSVEKTSLVLPSNDVLHPAPGVAAVAGSGQIDEASQKLVDSKVIPQLDLHDGPADAALPQAPVAEKDWTVAIELAATIVPHQGNPEGGGTERELPKLQALAKETSGKSVDFIVHADRLTDDSGLPCQLLGEMDKTVACMNDALGHWESQAVTERYFIHDGKIDKLPDAQYVDGAGDAEELLKEAGKLAPSKNLALIVDAHGSGNQGIFTNLGDVSLGDEMGAIQKGLAGSGHDKLDLLDFNACDMGEANVIDQSSKVAKDVVASSAVEFASRVADGQNVSEEMRTLLANSKMTGRELGEAMVKQAASGANGHGAHNGTQTLANFDLSNYDSFKDKLNGFGTALGAIAQDGGNMAQIQAEIEKTSVPESGMQDLHANDRDLKAFAGNILADSQAYKFSGDTGPLEDAAKALIKSFDPLVTASFGEKAKGYDKLGGMTAYLPGSEILDSDKVVRGLSPLHRASELLKDSLDSNPNFDDKQKILDDLQTKLLQVPVETEHAYPDEAQKIIDARDLVEKTNNRSDFISAMRKLQTVVSDADYGPMGEQVVSDLRAEAKSRQADDLKTRADQLAPDWDQFIRRVQAQAK